MKKHLFIFVIIAMAFSTLTAQNSNINASFRHETAQQLKTKTNISAELVERGVEQAAALWTTEDGTPEDFRQFCNEFMCKSKEEKENLFARLCDNFEVLYGHNNRVTIELQRPEQVIGYAPTSVDQIFSAYNGLSHFQDDMFANKLAFVVVLNFPHFTLAEKQQYADQWSGTEWGYARLGDEFTSRVPAHIQQNLSNVMAFANSYIDNYNVDMQRIRTTKGEQLWQTSMPLITHWGLRDELKSAYADKQHGLERQSVIYDVMKRIIYNEVPGEILSSNKNYTWIPTTNTLMLDGKIQSFNTKDKNLRYQCLLDFFKAEKAADVYYGNQSNLISRKFDDEYEISAEETKALFEATLTSPCFQQTAQLISQRIGRKLQAFDIWYDGFKPRSDMDQEQIDSILHKKYPTKDAFRKDLPNILIKLGFKEEQAYFICNHVSVDASVGAGHALESMMRNDNAMLRTRVGENGMDYKGYNIGVHEFGHNVEQTISLHYVPNYFMRGVPNTGFTEALAFTFQGKDLELLGLNVDNADAEDLNTLDLYWGCCEIMGVSLVDMRAWEWMYAHPEATAQELQDAVISIAKEVWNQYFAPAFKVKDEPILAIYSHMVIDPLYLPAYPMGHLIDFQLESFLKDKNMGEEVYRIYQLGRLIPQVWMERALGEKLSAQPLLNRTEQALKNLSGKKKK